MSKFDNIRKELTSIEAELQEAQRVNLPSWTMTPEQEAITQLEALIQRLRAEKEDLHEALRRKDQKRTELEEASAQHDRIIVNLRNERDKLKERLDEANKTVGELHQQARSSVPEQVAAVERLKARLESKDEATEIEHLKKLAEERYTRYNETLARNLGLTQENEGLRASLDGLKAQHNALSKLADERLMAIRKVMLNTLP